MLLCIKWLILIIYLMDFSFADIRRDGPNNSCSGEGAWGGKVDSLCVSVGFSY